VSAGPINIAQLKLIHRRFRSRNTAMVNASLKVAARQAEEHVRQRSTFKRRKARSLKDDTKHRIIKSRGGRILRLSWTKKYSPFVEYGTRPHRIVARRRAFLRFYLPRAGRVVYARRVNHPGTRPYKFGWKSAYAAHRVLGQHLQRGMDSIAQKF
jgi:hypothetical protein